MHSRIWIIAVGVSAVIAAFVAVHKWRTAGEADMRAATERIASAIDRGDRESLAGEPLLQDRPDTINWLLQYGPIPSGYRVTVRRNGANGHYLMSRDVVSHLGVIETASGHVCLGFWYDRETGQLRFVTASRFSFDIKPVPSTS